MNSETEALLREMVGLGKKAELILQPEPEPEPKPEPKPEPVFVPSGGNLQAALNNGGLIELEANGTYESDLFRATSNTTLVGNGATITGLRGPAFYVPPGTQKIVVSDAAFISKLDQAVILLGDNKASTQGSLEQVPREIELHSIKIPFHRGKRGVEVNATEVKILNPIIENVWDPALRDSQAVCVLNSPGKVHIKGGKLSAGSEIFMSGGDIMKIPNVVPTGIIIEDCTLYRPLSWRTDGTKRGIKNVIEFKTGKDVIVRNNIMDGHWVDAQSGWAIVLTPSGYGDPNTVLENILFENNILRNAGAGANVLGWSQHQATYPTKQSNNIRFNNNWFQLDHTVFGGAGRPFQILLTPLNLEIEKCTLQYSGTHVFGTDHAPQFGFKFIQNLIPVSGKYGMFTRNPDGSNLPLAARWQEALPDGIIEGNVFGSFPKPANLPGNLHLPSVEIVVTNGVGQGTAAGYGYHPQGE